VFNHNGGASLASLFREAVVSLPALLAHEEVERKFGLPKSRQLELIARGELDARKLGSRTFITTQSVLELIDRLPKAAIGVPSLLATKAGRTARSAARAERATP
jgi:hypothetical protein